MAKMCTSEVSSSMRATTIGNIVAASIYLRCIRDGLETWRQSFRYQWDYDWKFNHREYIKRDSSRRVCRHMLIPWDYQRNCREIVGRYPTEASGAQPSCYHKIEYGIVGNDFQTFFKRFSQNNSKSPYDMQQYRFTAYVTTWEIPTREETRRARWFDDTINPALYSLKILCRNLDCDMRWWCDRYM